MDKPIEELGVRGSVVLVIKKLHRVIKVIRGFGFILLGVWGGRLLNGLESAAG